MSLPPGQHLGPYEIVALIGAGGMGEVYQARDTRLDRTVAIKVLPARAAADRESRERFEREARAISALNHPHICTLHDVGRHEGTDFLVMEYIDGDTLAATIRLGPLAVVDAMRTARQIAEALEAAHEHGIVHRDLKPANIKITPDGQVKVLDFGLAKAIEPGAGNREAGLANSPTVTSPMMTGAGVILGTAAYMSPEQARGRAVDKRTDIWAFGCVCYEALTGHQAFPGESVTDVLAAIVKNEPDWSALPADTPAALRRTLARCLKKDLKERAHDIADVRLDLDEALAAPGMAAAEPARAPRRLTLAAIVGALVVLIASTAFVAGGRWNSARAGAPAPEWVGEFLGGSTVALGPMVSPDGKNLAFEAFVDNLTQVAVMRPETGNWQVLTRDRTRSAVQDMSWSPDGTRIYYDRLFDGPRGVFSVPVLGG
jgi:predicted Ser/Thr protein kinase